MAISKQKKGFTLLEVMIASVIGTIVLMAVVLILFMPVRTMRTNMEYAELRRDMAFAVQVMAKDIRKGSIHHMDNSSADVLVLLPNPDLPTISPDRIEYRRSAGDALNRYVNGVDLGPLIVRGLQVFSYEIIGDDTHELTNGLKGVSLHLEVQNPDGEIAITHETFIHARN